MEKQHHTNASSDELLVEIGKEMARKQHMSNLLTFTGVNDILALIDEILNFLGQLHFVPFVVLRRTSDLLKDASVLFEVGLWAKTYCQPERSMFPTRSLTAHSLLGNRLMCESANKAQIDGRSPRTWKSHLGILIAN